MLEHVAANPTSPFAHAYRSYVREVLVPRLNLIADIITQHGAYIEYPPMDYFKERFSGEASWGFCKTQCSSLSVFSRVSEKLMTLLLRRRPDDLHEQMAGVHKRLAAGARRVGQGRVRVPRSSLPIFSTRELKSAGAQIRHGQADGDDAFRRAVPDDHLVERAGGEETHGADRYEHGVQPRGRQLRRQGQGGRRQEDQRAEEPLRAQVPEEGASSAGSARFWRRGLATTGCLLCVNESRNLYQARRITEDKACILAHAANRRPATASPPTSTHCQPRSTSKPLAGHSQCCDHWMELMSMPSRCIS